MRRLPPLLAALALCASGADAQEPRVIQGAGGDRVVLRELPLKACATCLASVCLRNGAGNAGAKAIGVTGGPERRVSPGEMACLELAPVRQSLVLGAVEPEGPVPLVSVPLDLRGLGGGGVVLDWVVEGGAGR